MGRKLDALLGRNIRTSKFKTLAKLAISRIAILKNQRKVRCSHARSDVTELLNMGHQERALLRVEHVIKEQNMLDVFVMIENYCHLLIERVVLLQTNKECPDELKEAISSLIFASSRCGEFPELQHIRDIFTSRFGKDFAARAVELRNNCGVNPKMIQKISARQPSLESRLKILKEIAYENGITLNLEEYNPEVTEEKSNVNHKLEPNYYPASLDNSVLRDDTCDLPKKLNLNELSESIKAMKKYMYRDVAAAAQEAFESAAYAAAAARAAVELSRSESQDNYPDDRGGSSPQQGTVYNSNESSTRELQRDEYAAPEEIKHSNDILGFDNVYPTENLSLESEAEDFAENSGEVHLKGMEDSKNNAEIERTLSVSSSDSEGDILGETKLSSDLLNQGNMPCPKHHDLVSDRRCSLPTNEYQHIRQYDTVDEENRSEEDGNKLPYQSPNWIPLESQADPMIKPMEGKSMLASKHSLNTVEKAHSQHSNKDRKWISVRTRRGPRV